MELAVHDAVLFKEIMDAIKASDLGEIKEILKSTGIDENDLGKLRDFIERACTYDRSCKELVKSIISVDDKQVDLAKERLQKEIDGRFSLDEQIKYQTNLDQITAEYGEIMANEFVDYYRNFTMMSLMITPDREWPDIDKLTNNEKVDLLNRVGTYINDNIIACAIIATDLNKENQEIESETKDFGKKHKNVLEYR
jgi:hypothetical protein